MYGFTDFWGCFLIFCVKRIPIGQKGNTSMVMLYCLQMTDDFIGV